MHTSRFGYQFHHNLGWLSAEWRSSMTTIVCLLDSKEASQGVMMHAVIDALMISSATN
jgi:hypothetical protein